jgi:hypothetical protein
MFRSLIEEVRLAVEVVSSGKKRRRWAKQGKNPKSDVWFAKQAVDEPSSSREVKRVARGLFQNPGWQRAKEAGKVGVAGRARTSK